MTDSKMDEVKADRKLKGKTNFVGWKREFERAAKTNDILEYLTGEEVVPPKPKKEDYFVKITEIETRRLTKVKKTAQAVTPSTDGEEEPDNAQTMISTNNTLRWQIDYNVLDRQPLVGHVSREQGSFGYILPRSLPTSLII